jgi:hypothetical protein
MNIILIGLISCLIPSACLNSPSTNSWIDQNGRVVRANHSARLTEARRLCAKLEMGNGILGRPSNEDTINCMSAQGFYLLGTSDAATRPQVPAGQ